MKQPLGIILAGGQATRMGGGDKGLLPLGDGTLLDQVIARLEPVILELERHKHPVLVIAHQAVLRALLSYLTGSPPEECPFASVPLHTVLKVEPGPYGSAEQRIALGP